MYDREFAIEGFRDFRAAYEAVVDDCVSYFGPSFDLKSLVCRLQNENTPSPTFTVTYRGALLLSYTTTMDKVELDWTRHSRLH